MTVNHLYPTTRPTLDLNFARQKRLDPRVTFTRGSTATYVGDDGLIKTAASNEARFDHDPATGESLGLLVEENRTNNLTYSAEFDNAAWTKARTTVTANAAVAPDGTTTADKLIPNTDINTNVAYQAVSLSQTTYTFSVFAKQAEYDFCTLVLPNTQGWDADRWISVDLTDGSYEVSSSAPTSTSVEEYPNGWYRISITHAASGTVSRSGYIVPRSTSGYTNQGGDGTSGIYIWGSQLEAGSFPTSYIPTTSSTVTRSADVASMTGTNFSSWYNQSEGTTLFTEKGKTSDTQYPIAIEGSTTNDRHLFVVSNAYQYQIRVGGATEAQIDAGSITTKNTIGGVYIQNNVAVSLNGSSAVVDTSASMPSCIQMKIGHWSSTTYNGHVSRLTYYPTRLTDSQLQELTR